MALHGAAMLLNQGGYSGYQIDQSALFDGSSDYLSRTPSTTGDRKKWTTSFWVRRHKLSEITYLFTCAAVSGNDGIAALYFNASDELVTYYDTSGANPVGPVTTRKYRDVGSWYHIIWAVDAVNTVHRIWVNGVELTANASYYPPNFDYGMNYAGHAMTTGTQAWGPLKYADISIAELHHLDGQYITDPTTFGEFYNGTTAWRPIQPSGLTYGTNGFYLPFTQDTPNLGTDYSGNGNDWTENGSPVQSSDSPTINVCTLTPLMDTAGGTISNGNRTYGRGSTSAHGTVGASMAIPSTGKWYWEVTASASTNTDYIGVADITQSNPQLAGNQALGYNPGDHAYRSNGQSYISTTLASYGASYTNGDVIGILWNSDDGELTFYKNNATQGVAASGIAQEEGRYVPAGSSAETSNTLDFAFAEDELTYTIPTGYKTLSAANLPDPTITDPGEYFNVVGYTASNSTQSITGVGFQPDLTWHKNRTDANRHALFDVLRGVTNRLASDNTDAEVADADTLTSFDSDGFSIGADTGQFGVNDNGSQEFVTWCWKSGGAGVPNTDGTTTATVSANDDAGFSIATWASPLSATTIGHGLSAEPELIIAREYDGVMSWRVYHKDVGNGHYLLLDTTGAKSATSDWNSTDPTSSVFSVSDRFNTAGNYLAYCFRSIPGYSKVFSYTGNGSADGPFVYLGFKPRWVMVKRVDNISGWMIGDALRPEYNDKRYELRANDSSAEVTTISHFDILSNGFKKRYTDFNASGGTYIGIAFAENPFGGSNIPLGLAQ